MFLHVDDCRLVQPRRSGIIISPFEFRELPLQSLVGRDWAEQGLKASGKVDLVMIPDCKRRLASLLAVGDMASDQDIAPRTKITTEDHASEVQN